MQNQTKERSYTFVGMREAVAALPDLEPHDIDARDEAIAEMRTDIDRVLKLAMDEYLFNPKATVLLAARGELDLLKFCLDELECPVDAEAYIRAAERGHLECMKLLEGYGPINYAEALYKAVISGELKVVMHITKTHRPNIDMKRLTSSQKEGGFPDVKKFLRYSYDIAL